MAVESVRRLPESFAPQLRTGARRYSEKTLKLKKEDEQEVVEEDLFENLEEEQERRRKRVDQTFTSNLPCTASSRLPNPFNLSLLQEAYIYSSQVRMEKNI